MKIREFAKSVGHEVVGKIRYVGKSDKNCRLYLDEANNEYYLDVVLGSVCIVCADGSVI